MRNIITYEVLRRALSENGYTVKRTKGSHQIWSNGLKTVSIPIVKLNPMLARRIAKECNFVFLLDK